MDLDWVAMAEGLVEACREAPQGASAEMALDEGISLGLLARGDGFACFLGRDMARRSPAERIAAMETLLRETHDSRISQVPVVAAVTPEGMLQLGAAHIPAGTAPGDLAPVLRRLAWWDEDRPTALPSAFDPFATGVLRA